MIAQDCAGSGNRYVWFRGRFPAAAHQLRIYADDFYELWNNGEFISYGPARSGDPLLYFDSFRLSGRVNHVAVKVHGRKRIPALYCEADGETPVWRAKTSVAYSPDAPYTIGDAGYTEYYDLDSGEEAYSRTDFDDSAWSPVICGRIVEASHFFERPIPLFCETGRVPKFVKNAGELLYDFGEMVYGRVEISGSKTNSSAIFVEYIEDLESGWASAANRREMYADRLTGKTGEFRWKSFSKRGFRYIAIHGGGIENITVCVQEYRYPLSSGGSFRCSDARLNRLWEISERTLRICMDDIFNDCPHRDQAQWMDAFVSSKAALSLFGVTDLTKKSILQHAVCSFKDGKLLSPSIQGWHFMQDYAMIQILFIRWYYQVTKDRKLIGDLWGNCTSCVTYMKNYQEKDGLLANVVGAYLDNAFELCRLGKNAAMNALYYAALNAMSDLADILEKNDEGTAYRAQAAEFSAAYHRVFGVPGANGALRDSSERPEKPFFNYNFSCEFNNNYMGKTAKALFEIELSEAKEITLYTGAFGPYRIFCNGSEVFRSEREADWPYPLPAYAPDINTVTLAGGLNKIEFEVDCNFLNWDFFFDAEGIRWGEGTIWEFDPADGSIISAPRKAAPRYWEPPAFSQTTHGYAAYAGLIGKEALQTVLRDTYYRNYISVRVPLFAEESRDPAKLRNWVLSPNTPWTMFYFLSGLFENGLKDEAFSLLRRAWGVMLDNNAVNTWEEWNKNSSLCHAWGASPCYFFHREILGVKHEFLHQGKIVVKPELFDLESASGRVMLDQNSWIDIDLYKTDGTVNVKIENHSAYRLEKEFSGLGEYQEIN